MVVTARAQKKYVLLFYIFCVVNWNLFSIYKRECGEYTLLYVGLVGFFVLSLSTCCVMDNIESHFIQQSVFNRCCSMCFARAPSRSLSISLSYSFSLSLCFGKHFAVDWNRNECDGGQCTRRVCTKTGSNPMTMNDEFVVKCTYSFHLFPHSVVQIHKPN